MIPKHDLDALRSVLPPSVDIASPFSYFSCLVDIFESIGHAPYMVTFSRRAIDSAPEDEDTEGLWHNVFTGQANLCEFEDAYMTLVATPHPNCKRLFSAAVLLTILQKEERNQSSCPGYVRRRRCGAAAAA